ncbi:vacuolar membrane protein-domain-containing protein [Mrakia frigida]|uniref:uncharacterized protein n=1 Tax=Mrakia frigida TaxID=29902 RepID=UPI003FCBF765
MPVVPPPVVPWLPAASPVPTPPLLPSSPIEGGNCELFLAFGCCWESRGGTGLMVQALMGVLVIATLLVKRSLEHPKRPWKIWALDNSKQFLGQAIVHASNILISTFPAPSSTPLLSTSSSDSRTSFILTTRPQPSPSLPPNPCSLYFLNVLIDTTFGVILIAYLLKLSRYVFVDKLQLEGFDMGVYKDGKRWNCWAKQAAVFVSSLLIMKSSVLVIFAVLPEIFSFGSWFLSWLPPSGQVVFVMAIFPLAMNILQFTLLDSVLKHSSPASPSLLDPTTSSSTPRRPPHPIQTSAAYTSLPTSDPLPDSPTSVSQSPRLPSTSDPLLSPRPSFLRQRSGSVASSVDGERSGLLLSANMGGSGREVGVDEEEEMRVGTNGGTKGKEE